MDKLLSISSVKGCAPLSTKRCGGGGMSDYIFSLPDAELALWCRRASNLFRVEPELISYCLFVKLRL